MSVVARRVAVLAHADDCDGYETCDGYAADKPCSCGCHR